MTRARLNTELLNEDVRHRARRSALLRDLQEMASLVNDLLESERLGSRPQPRCTASPPTPPRWHARWWMRWRKATLAPPCSWSWPMACPR
jgi:signal transduction histidine kinase